MWIAGLVEVLIMLQRPQHRQTGTCSRLVSLAIAGSVDATATLDFRATNDRQSALSMVDRQPLPYHGAGSQWEITRGGARTARFAESRCSYRLANGTATCFGRC
jgi:hypothetical protein